MPLLRLSARRRYLVPAGVLLGVVVLIAVFYYPGPRTSHLPAPACAGVLVVGLRGNGDSPDAGHGMGDDSWAVARRLAGSRLLGQLGATIVGFPYNTGPWWRIGGHVRSGMTALLEFLRERHQRCPAERLVLIGQSEGAAVIHLALPSLGDRLTAAVLLADPLRAAKGPVDDLGQPPDGILAHLLMGGWAGVGPAQDIIPASMTARVRSYCLKDDPVCHPSLAAIWGRTQRDVHTSYRYNPDGVAERAAEFIASRLLQ